VIWAITRILLRLGNVANDRESTINFLDQVEHAALFGNITKIIFNGDRSFSHVRNKARDGRVSPIQRNCAPAGAVWLHRENMTWLKKALTIRAKD
jgi:hypothetical protein